MGPASITHRRLRRAGGAILAALLLLAPAAAHAAPGAISLVPGHACLTPTGLSKAGGSCDTAPWASSLGMGSAFTQDGKTLYVIDTNTANPRLLALARDPSSGALSPTSWCGQVGGANGCQALPTYPQWVGTFQQGGTTDVYVGGEGTIASLRRQADGSLAATSCLREGDGDRCADAPGTYYNNQLHVAPDGRQIYTVGYQNVFVWDRDPETGALTASAAQRCVGPAYTNSTPQVPCDGQPIRGAGTAYNLVLSKDGKLVFVAGQQGLAVFDRDPVTGVLTQKAGVAGCLQEIDYGDGCRVDALYSGNAPMALAPDARQLYVVTRPGGWYGLMAIPLTADGGIAAIPRPQGCYGASNPEPGTGAPCTVVDSAYGYPAKVVVSPDGANVYTYSNGSEADRVLAFARDASTGALTKLTGAGGCLSYDGRPDLGAGPSCAAHGMGLGGWLFALDPTGHTLYVSGLGSPGAGILELARDVPDLAAPTIAIESPAGPSSTVPVAKQTFHVGDRVLASYRCDDDRQIASCTGPVPSGQPIDTGHVGTNLPFKVIAHDAAGHETTLTHFYDVVAASVPIDPAPETKDPGPGTGGGGTPPSVLPPVTPVVPQTTPVVCATACQGGVKQSATVAKKAPSTIPNGAALASGSIGLNVLLQADAARTQMLAGHLISPIGSSFVVAPGGGNVVAPGGGNVVAPGGGNVVAPGGGNVVAPGGGNVVAPGGGNVVAPGGGNLAGLGGSSLVFAGGPGLTATQIAGVVASGGGNAIFSGASLIGRNAVPARAAKGAKQQPRLTLLDRGGTYFAKPGKAKVRLKVGAGGRKALKRVFRKRGRQTVTAVYLIAVRQGDGPTVVSGRIVKIKE